MSDLQCAVTVLLVRHGDPVDTSRRAGAGRRLSARGRGQVAALAARIADRRVAHVHASTLQPGADTGRLLGAALSVGVAPDPDLVELTAGSWDGYDDAERTRTVDGVFAAWLGGDLAPRAGDGETGREAVARLRAGLDGLADAYRGETVVAVSHAGLMTCGLAALVPGLSGRWVQQHPLDGCAVVELAADADGWVCRSWAGQAPA